MVKINLRKYYPGFYTTDCIIEVPDEVAALMDSSERAEAAYCLRRYRHKAYYSLDRSDGIEHDILFVSPSLCEIYEHKVIADNSTPPSPTYRTSRPNASMPITFWG